MAHRFLMSFELPFKWLFSKQLIKSRLANNVKCRATRSARHKSNIQFFDELIMHENTLQCLRGTLI